MPTQYKTKRPTCYTQAGHFYLTANLFLIFLQDILGIAGFAVGGQQL